MKREIGHLYYRFVTWLEFRSIHVGQYWIDFAWPMCLYNGIQSQQWSGGWQWGRKVYPFGSWAINLGPIQIYWETKDK